MRKLRVHFAVDKSRPCELLPTNGVHGSRTSSCCELGTEDRQAANASPSGKKNGACCYILSADQQTEKKDGPCCCILSADRGGGTCA